MKLLKSTNQLVIPNDVTIEVKGRCIRVKGPRGTLSREFKHCALDMFLVAGDATNEKEKGRKVFKVESHFTKRKQLASLRTIVSHVQNLVLGVTKGFEYKMRMVYAHFPININIAEKGTIVEVRNFLGEKRVRVVKMMPGITVTRSEGVKDELVFIGNDKDFVSRSCAHVSQSCAVKGGLDLRKFLDGIYVSETGLIGGSQ